MGKTYTPVPFFDEQIRIDSHSATKAWHLGRITILEFANGQPVSLACCEETGELLVQCGRMGEKGYRFMQGPEI